MMALMQRTCIGCNQVKSKKELLRIVRDPNSKSVIFDLLGNKNGRGAYVCPNINCINKAINTRRMKRALRIVNDLENIIDLDLIYNFLKEDNKKL